MTLPNLKTTISEHLPDIITLIGLIPYWHYICYLNITVIQSRSGGAMNKILSKINPDLLYLAIITLAGLCAWKFFG